jgi:acyl-CoA reductase-like NAD-dependent aldehyde dehydrogenase
MSMEAFAKSRHSEWFFERVFAMEAQPYAERQRAQRKMVAVEGVFSIVNPATNEKVGEYPLMGPAEVAEAIGRARSAFPAWAKTRFSVRAGVFRRAAAYLAENAERYARIICSETGKTELDALLAEMFPTCDVLHYYAKNAEKSSSASSRGRSTRPF